MRLVAEKRWPRTIWDELATTPTGRCARQVMCGWCATDCLQGDAVRVRPPGPDGHVTTVHERCLGPATAAQLGPYGGIGDMGGWLQDRGIPLPAWAGFALAELLVVTYRRIYDLESLDWSSRPQKTCRKPRPCAICGEQLLVGARYVDGGGTEKSAHVACAGVEEEWKKQADERAAGGAA